MKVNGRSLAAHLSHRQNFPYGVRELRAFSGSSMVLFNIPGSAVKPDPVRPPLGYLNGHPWPRKLFETVPVPKSLTAIFVEACLAQRPENQ